MGRRVSVWLISLLGPTLTGNRTTGSGSTEARTEASIHRATVATKGNSELYSSTILQYHTVNHRVQSSTHEASSTEGVTVLDHSLRNTPSSTGVPTPPVLSLPTTSLKPRAAATTTRRHQPTSPTTTALADLRARQHPHPYALEPAWLVHLPALA